MRVVAGGAARRQGRMNVLLFDSLGHVGMAAEAQIFALLQKQLLGIRRVGGVTERALSGGDGTVNDFEIDVIRMTGLTQLLHWLHQQLGLIR